MDSSASKQQFAQPGWYPDPSGSGRSKWWDGTGWAEEEWEARTENPPAARVFLPRPMLGPRVPVFTPFIWMFMALPVVWALVVATWLASINASEDITTDGLVFLTMPVLYAGFVVLAYLDWRRLCRVGVLRPFHWGWGFLPGIYVIGRTVIIRKVAPERGMAPVWLLILYVLIGIFTPAA